MNDGKGNVGMEHPVARFKELFCRLNAENTELGLLQVVYSPTVIFEDIFHRVEGLDALHAYFKNIYSNVLFCEFAFSNEWVAEGSAMLTWKMDFAHRRLNAGKLIEVEGATHLRFDGKVFYHRDYLDGGAMLYEQVPILGAAIRQIKKRMVTS